MDIVLYLSYAVPAQSCLCESTIASQTAMQDDCILQFPSAVVSYEKGGPITSDVDNINDGMADSNYVFCNDEVTFYSPGTELNESGTDDDEEGNIKCADVQVHVDSCYAQNNASIDMSYTQPINSFNEKAVCSKTPLNVEKTDVAIVVSRGKNNILQLDECSLIHKFIMNILNNRKLLFDYF